MFLEVAMVTAFISRQVVCVSSKFEQENGLTSFFVSP